MFSLKVGHNWVLNQKNVVLLPGKAENKKYTETETWQFRPSLGPKKCFLFCLILQEFWGLSPTLFDIPEDVVFVDILVFSNIFGFPVVNWAQKRNKTVNFRCLPFIPNSKFWRIFKQCFSYWRLPLVKISARLKDVWGSKGSTKKPGCWISIKWMLNQYKKLLASQPQILYWWNFP